LFFTIFINYISGFARFYVLFYIIMNKYYHVIDCDQSSQSGHSIPSVNAMVDVTLIRPLIKGQGHSFWCQSISHIWLPGLSVVTFALWRTV